MAIRLSTIKENPDNPRIIKDEKFTQLVKSLKDFPEMMKLRPIVVDENNTALGGNMRLKALHELGYKTVPQEWVKKAKDLTEDQKKEFIVKDNVGFGEWNWDQLTNNWDQEQLQEWGLDLPDFKFDPENKEKEIDENLETENECPKCHYRW